MMVKVFTVNSSGKIEFTKDELEKLLNEVWTDGNSRSYTWSSPHWYGTINTPYTVTNDGITITCGADSK